MEEELSKKIYKFTDGLIGLIHEKFKGRKLGGEVTKEMIVDYFFCDSQGEIKLVPEVVKPQSPIEEKVESPKDTPTTTGGNSKKSTKKAIDNEKTVVDAINGNFSEFSPEVWESLSLNPGGGIKCSQVNRNNGFYVKNTESWKELKEGTKERAASSKTDICIKDICDNTSRMVSLKSGKGRWTSSDCYETRAIFMTVYKNKYREDKDILNIIEEIISKMKELGKKKPIRSDRTIKSIKKEIENNMTVDEDLLWVNKLTETEKRCNYLWRRLRTEFPEYIKDILFECVTGEFKFGDNEGRAGWLIETYPNTTKVKCHFKLDKRTKELDEHLLDGISNNPFKAKTGGTGKEMWIRFL